MRVKRIFAQALNTKRECFVRDFRVERRALCPIVLLLYF